MAKEPGKGIYSESVGDVHICKEAVPLDKIKKRDTVMYGVVEDEDRAAIVDCIERGVKEVVGTLIVEFGSFGKAPLVEQVSLEEMAERYRKAGI